MKIFLRLVIILALFLTGTFSAKATHIVGGEIYYDSLGNNMYKITFEIYRDCSSFTDYDNPLDYTIFYGNGSIWSQFSVTIFSRDTLPIVYDDPCVTPPDDICIERAIYIDTVTLPFDVMGYYISYQRCCWATNIMNITDPGNNGITLTNYIPGSSLVDYHNQAARFVNYPPLVLCSNNTLTFDHSAFDPDGDSLAYELAAPFLGGNSGNVTPNPESAPPYSDVVWEPGFSATVPFGAGSSVLVDPVTGSIDFTPNLIGNYVAGVAVKEYRDGVLINTKIRTFGYRVVGCTVEIPLEVNITGPNVLIEDCGFAGFIVSRTDTTEELTVQVLLSGSATNGVDYNFIPDTLIIPAGVASDTIGISAVLDGITEGDETVSFNIIIENPCEGTYDTTSISLIIQDYINMEMTHTDSLNICAEFGENTFIWCNVENGVPPYTYSWGPGGGFPNNDTVFIPGNILIPNLNQFTVSVGDHCGKGIISAAIDVYNQCPLVVPNVMTANGDGTNDALIITNLEDFDKVSIKIFNRWGNLIYENSNYKNDWTGYDASGKLLNEGVYFYMVTPSSEKFEYDDVKKTLYTAHGFFHLYTK